MYRCIYIFGFKAMENKENIKTKKVKKSFWLDENLNEMLRLYAFSTRTTETEIIHKALKDWFKKGVK
ncbi:MAG: hypothetical protein BWY78_01059 [Alphaproteobacteria bacterium ADurb.Bin438]|nr:MAG: hypothetical protein BWY78_01059 [Alphaproteobacteria bacterium ADurb.Bin438]